MEELLSGAKGWTVDFSSYPARRTALMCAAAGGHTEAVLFLLRKGASLLLTTQTGDNALHHAAAKGHLAVCELLVAKHFADPAPKNSTGETPQQLAEKGGHREVVAFFKEPLMFLQAAAAGDVQKMEELLSGAKGWTVDFSSYPARRTALMCAAAGGHTEAVLFLLRKGADALARDKSGDSALEYSVFPRHARVVVALLLAQPSPPINDDVHDALATHYSCADHRDNLMEYLRSPFFSLLLRIERSDQSLVAIEVSGDLEGVPANPDDAAAQVCSTLEVNTNPRLSVLTLKNLSFGEASEAVLAACLAQKPQITSLDLTGNKVTGSKLCETLPPNLTILILANNAIRRIPSSLTKLTNLKHLSLEHCAPLDELPVALCALTSLTSLLLAGTAIRHIPLELQYLPLQQLTLPESCTVDAGGNIPSEFLQSERAIPYLRTFGAFLLRCRTVDTLELRPGAVENTPSRSEDLCAVLALELEANQNLHTLRLMDLKLQAGVHMDKLFSDRGGCKNLTLLDVSGNTLGRLPDLSALTKLEQLTAANCELASLENIRISVCVTTFDVSQNPLAAVPGSLANALPKLTVFVARDCQVAEFPNSIAALPTLTRLDLVGNTGIRVDVSVPSSDSEARLQTLLLASCGLEAFPPSLLCLTGLTSLDLSSNPLTQIPLTIGVHLPVLASLNTAECPLRPFPAGSFLDGKTPESALPELRKQVPVPRSTLMFVGFGGVGKSALADALLPAASAVEVVGPDGRRQTAQAQITQGAVVSVSGTQSHTISLLESRCSHDPHDTEDRSIVLSHAQQSWTLRFGDTALRDEWFGAIRRVQSNSATEGVSVRHVALDAVKLSKLKTIPAQLRGADGSVLTVQVSVWDFAGQEELYHGHRLFLRRGAIYVVVWDASAKYQPRLLQGSTPVVTSTQSNRDGALADLQYWLEALQATVGGDVVATNVCVLIVANKTDCAPAGETSAQRDVQVQQVIKRAGLTLPHLTFETSCKPGMHEGVGVLRQALFEQIVAQSEIGKPVPAATLALRDALRTVASEKRAAGEPMVAAAASLEPLAANMDELGGLLAQVHRWSECVYFPHVAPSVVVLEPQWLVQKVFSGLLAAGQHASPPGVVLQADLARILKGAGHTEEVVRLLHEYSLLFPFRARGSADDPASETEERFFLPAALSPSKPTAHAKPSEDHCWVRVSFPVPGLLGAVLVAAQAQRIECVAEQSWRNGLVLRRATSRAVVELAQSSGAGGRVVAIAASDADFVSAVRAAVKAAVQQASPNAHLEQVDWCATCHFVPYMAGAQQCTKGHSLRSGGVGVALKPWIMISYNWAQQNIALKLKALLEAAGYVVWMDVDRMAGNIDDAMAEAVEGADAVIVCLSAKYKASLNCKKEFQHAQQLKKPIIPVRVEAVKAEGWLAINTAGLIYYDQVHSDAALAQTVQEIISKELKQRNIEPRRLVAARAQPNYTQEVASTAPEASVSTAPSASEPGFLAASQQIAEAPKLQAQTSTPLVTSPAATLDVVALLQAQLAAQQQQLQAQEQRHQEQMQAHRQQMQAQIQAQEAQQQSYQLLVQLFQQTQQQMQAQEHRHQAQMDRILDTLRQLSPSASLIPVAGTRADPGKLRNEADDPK
eukprot:TRINITY_DN1806_c0_g2_i5.p1 TRINITY_DN1806_c0_g2~~TRINITY_DN1806_c0_g2_i5.p1  ORF type:complete len:1631 (+),score=363.83 TRINITY_DN1806_c0_g2_i5:31-4893(+)